MLSFTCQNQKHLSDNKDVKYRLGLHEDTFLRCLDQFGSTHFAQNKRMPLELEIKQETTISLPDSGGAT